MYAGRVACCLLVSHVEYVPRALIRLEKCAARPIKVRKKMGQTDRRIDGRQTVTLCLPLDAAKIISQMPPTVKNAHYIISSDRHKLC